MAIGDQQDVGVEPTISPPSSVEVLAQLERIRLSAEFDAPDRDRKFLAYVIEETLAATASRPIPLPPRFSAGIPPSTRKRIPPFGSRRAAFVGHSNAITSSPDAATRS